MATVPLTLESIGMTPTRPASARSVIPPPQSVSVRTRPLPKKTLKTEPKSILKAPPKTKQTPAPPRKTPQRQIELNADPETIQRAYDSAFTKATMWAAPTQITGFTSTNKEIVFAGMIAKAFPDEQVMVCYPPKSRSIPLARAGPTTGVYSLKVREYNIEADKLIYADTVSAKEFLLQLHNTKKPVPEWVIINAWDTGDIDAVLVHGLIKHLGLKCKVVLSSVSGYSNVPPDDYRERSTEIPSRDIIIEYIRQSEVPLIIARSTGPVAYYTTNPRAAFYAGKSDVSVYETLHERHDGPLKVIIDDLYSLPGKTNTKYAHSYLSDQLIQGGIVYRVKKDINTVDLPTNIKPRWSERELTRATSFLASVGIDADDVFKGVGEKYISPTRELYSKLGVTDKQLSVSRSYNLTSSGTALMWAYPAEFTRSKYVSALVAALLSINIDGDLLASGELQEFSGRNDIETLSNMWQSLLLCDVSKPFIKWPSNSDSVAQWVKRRPRMEDAARGLLDSMYAISRSMTDDEVRNFENQLTSEELTQVSSFLAGTVFKNPKGEKKAVSGIPNKVQTISAKQYRVPFESGKYPVVVLSSSESYKPLVLPKESFADL